MRRRDERGAVAVFTAAILALLVGVSAFAVDLGMQRVVRRDMQAVADIVALDAGRFLGGADTAAALLARVDFKAAMKDSVDRNSDTALGDAPLVKIEAGRQTGEEFTPLGYVEYRAGTASVGAVQSGQGATPNAFRVTARTDVAFGFAASLGVNSGSAGRSAISTAQAPSVCFSVGAKTLTLNTDESALGPLLSQILSVRLSAVGYDGLVSLKNVSVPIADLLVQLDVGTTDELLNTSVSLADFMVAAANALRANGDTASAEVLEAVELGVPGLDIPLGDILGIATGTDIGGLEADVNVLDIIGAGIIAANGENALTVSVPGVTNIKIVEPPKIACGAKGATATSGQIQLQLKPTLLNTGLPWLLNTDVDLSVVVGAATATIDADLTCLPDTVTMTTKTGAVSVLPPVPPKQGQVKARVTLARLVNQIPGLGALISLPLALLGVSSISLDIAVKGGVAETTDTEVITFPAPPAEPPVVRFPVGATGDALTLELDEVKVSLDQEKPGVLAILNPVLGLLLGGVVVPVVNPVIGLLNGALTPLFNTLTSLLGLKLGVADVRMMGRPVCNGIKLIG